LTEVDLALRPPGPSMGELDDGLPQLAELPREQWRTALKPLAARERYRCAQSLPAELQSEAVILAAELDITDPPPRAERVVEGAAVPRVDLMPPMRGSPRQVSFRISDGEHARLRRAAAHVGLRPAQLARLLVLRGADGLLREYD